jgi:hypothetical protein
MEKRKGGEIQGGKEEGEKEFYEGKGIGEEKVIS